MPMALVDHNRENEPERGKGDSRDQNDKPFVGVREKGGGVAARVAGSRSRHEESMVLQPVGGMEMAKKAAKKKTAKKKTNNNKT